MGSAMLLHRGEIWNIGQLTRERRAVIARLVREGRLVRSAECWACLGNERSVWREPPE